MPKTFNMPRAWDLYKLRVIAMIALALLGGYSLMTWLYFKFERNYPITYGSFILYVGVLGLLLSAVMFFFIAQFVVQSGSGTGGTTSSSDLEDYIEQMQQKRNSEWLVDPTRNAQDWGVMDPFPGGSSSSDD